MSLREAAFCLGTGLLWTSMAGIFHFSIGACIFGGIVAGTAGQRLYARLSK